VDEITDQPAAGVPIAAPAPVATTEDVLAARRRKSIKSAIEWVAIIGGAFLAALLIKTFLLQAFFIPSASMETTLMKGDRVLVNKLSYDLHDLHRGDIVVFERPPGEEDQQIHDLIKRVIGLPGDTIEARDDGRIYIDDKPLDEPYLKAGTVTDRLPRQTVPEGQVFVMGDNRGDSKDSRFFGAIDQSLIVGRAFIRVWPPSRIKIL
jgi:signal peptidase I